jgi:hypothetical protein
MGGSRTALIHFFLAHRPFFSTLTARYSTVPFLRMQVRAFIACILNENPEAVYEGHAFQVEDCAAAVENMLLPITALSCASVWIDHWSLGFPPSIFAVGV